MSATKKATLFVPNPVIAACRRCIDAMKARSPAAGYARLITDGTALLGRTSQVIPKLVDRCHDKYPDFDREISAHIPTSGEQARHLKQAKALGSLREVYLEALLASLVDRGFMTAALETAYPSGVPAAQHGRAAREPMPSGEDR